MFRLWGYQFGLFPTRRLDCRVISVGNLTLGGTGKTPLVKAIAGYLKQQQKRVVILSRGYMDKHSSKSYDFSDEAAMLEKDLEGVDILTGQDRVKNAKNYLKNHPLDIFVMDDGFQYWRAQRNLDVVVINSRNPFGNGQLIPRGILREPLESGRIIISRAARQ